jgi:hypothetical protein
VTGITVTAGQEVVVAIADTRITNPAKVRADGIGDSYEFTISNANDTAKTRVVIIDTAGFIAQQLNVTTNARHGFVVSVEKDAPLQSSTGADIDEFVDSADDVEQTVVGFKIEASSLQEAGDDCNTTLTYIATPSF